MKRKRHTPQEIIAKLREAEVELNQSATHGEETENLRVVINQLRKKIEKDPARPRYVLTEPWLGYRFQFPIVAPERVPRRKS